MKTIKSLGTFIKESTDTPNLTHRFNVICKAYEKKPSRYKDADAIWNLFESYSIDFLNTFPALTLGIARELIAADKSFKSQYFDPTEDF